MNFVFSEKSIKLKHASKSFKIETLYPTLPTNLT